MQKKEGLNDATYEMHSVLSRHILEYRKCWVSRSRT